MYDYLVYVANILYFSSQLFGSSKYDFSQILFVSNIQKKKNYKNLKTVTDLTKSGTKQKVFKNTY